MRILVTGGAGYIGSVLVEELMAAGHETTVYDNLSKGHRDAVAPGAEFIHGELADRPMLTGAMEKRRIEAVIHMAADSLVSESFQNPAKYFANNFIGTLALLESMHAVGISRLVFSSTAAVYGESVKQPIDELQPAVPTNPYGESKLACEKVFRWYEQAYGLRYVSLRYFNAAGATERCGERHNPESHLIPIVLQVAAGQRPSVEVFGSDYPTRDGTCVRDYIHVTDLARAHILGLRRLEQSSAIFNLGAGGGNTVLEVIEAARVVTGKAIPVHTGPRRSGDPAVLIASSEKIKQELGWVPERQDLSLIIESAWKWMQAGVGVPA